jgi:hypothetical protein
LADTRVTDKLLVELNEFPKLDSLSFQNTSITDAGLEYLARLKSLAFVHLNGTKVTPEGVGKLRKRFPEALVRYDE